MGSVNRPFRHLGKGSVECNILLVNGCHTAFINDKMNYWFQIHGENLKMNCP